MIADPLTLLQCCPIADGAAAAVVTSHRAPARHGGRRAFVGAALRAPVGPPQRARVGLRADPRHRGRGGLRRPRASSPADVDVVECHDAFTIGEIVTTEALGLAAVGAGAGLLHARHTHLGGPQPVNPSGGLLSRGHPLGATGLAQTAEIVWQLLGRAGGRQHEGARLGLVETMGGGVAGVDGNACAIAVLEHVR